MPLYSGSAIGGSVELGNGSDTLTVYGGASIGSNILDGGDDSSTGDGYTDTLVFKNYSGSVVGANLLNWEVMDLTGSTLTISGGALEVGDGTAGTGVFLASGSTLDASGGLDLTANLTIDSSSTFEATGGGSGVYNIGYNLANSGTINMADGGIGDHITVTGDYVSSGGVMNVDVDFQTLSADYITASGTVSGRGTIYINDLTTNYTGRVGEVLLIEEPQDSSKGDEDFVLASAQRYNGDSHLARFTSTPFIWKLKTEGNNWVLGYAFDAPVDPETPATPATPTTSTTNPTEVSTSSGKHAVVSEIPAYISLPTFSYEMVNNELDTMHMRLGELRHKRANSGSAELLGYAPAIEFDPEQLNGWIRVTYANFSFKPEENFAMDGEYGATNLGFDRKFATDAGAFYLGAFGGFASGDFANDGRGSTYGSLYAADTDIDAKSAGLYGTWFSYRGYYIDVVAEYMDMDADIEALDHYATDGDMLGFSVELGQSFRVSENLIVEPQAQIKLADVSWDSFNDGWNDVSFEEHTYVTGRLGVRSEYTYLRRESQEIKPWFYAGLQQEFTDSPDVHYVIDFESHQYETTGNVQAGITANLADWVQLYGDAGLTSNLNDYNSFRLDFGLRMKW